jgi:CMP-N-acetylneuraminic acid synthetase
MMTSPTNPLVVALVPMRHHSARVEGKNYRKVAGRPLYSWILDTLLLCDGLSRIVVDTDSPIITRGIQGDYPGIEVINRPVHLRADEIPMNEILLYDVGQVESEFYLQTHSTNPLLSINSINNALDSFFQAWPENDSLFSVTSIQARFWTPEGEAVNHDPGVLIPTQDLHPLLIENSCIYIFSREGLLANRNRIGSSPVLYEIDHQEALDIDTEWELELAEMLLRKSGS